MADETPKAEELMAQIDHRPPAKQWMDVPAEIRKGMYCYAANPKSVEYLGLPHARQWNPVEDDWHLPEINFFRQLLSSADGVCFIINISAGILRFDPWTSEWPA